MTDLLANNYCTACGNLLIDSVAICPKCGTPTQKGAEMSGTAAKSKTTAVLLAVFLGGWSWLYTYSVNKWKFWIPIFAFSISYVGAIGLFFQKAAYLQVISEILKYIIIFLYPGCWLWAIIYYAVKPRSWYANYPNKRLS